ncbi:hypothetical protein KC336_g14455 [Hortaea werneckii]|nr:hypothetical protein KC336_g14455 [Hortaea werneckii]
MSNAGPSRQSIHHVAPHLRQFAEARNIPINEARVELAGMAKSKQPPPPHAPAQSVDKSEAEIAQMQQMQQMSHGTDSVEGENSNLRNELNKLRDQFEKGMSNLEKKVEFLKELLAVVVNKNFPECEGLNEAWEYYISNAGGLPASQSNITPMGQNTMPQQQQQQQQQQMVPQQHQMMQQFSNLAMTQQQFPQQQEQALQFSQLPHGISPSPMSYAPNQYNTSMPACLLQPQQQHPMLQQMPQTVSNPPMMQQQYAYQQPQQQPIQLPCGVNNPQMGYAFNSSSMQTSVGQAQAQQQPTYGSAMMPYLGQGGMLPHSYQQ